MPTLFKAKIGGTLYIYDEGKRDAVVAEILRKARRTGEMAYFPMCRVWFVNDPIVDTTKSGSAQYTWSKDGNRVKCNVIKHTVTRIDGHITETVGQCFADLD